MILLQTGPYVLKPVATSPLTFRLGFLVDAAGRLVLARPS